MKLGFLVDLHLCMGCKGCEIACKVENEVPLSTWRLRVKYVDVGTFPETKRTFTPLRCNHCENAPCVRCCPTGASHYSDGGIVLVTPNKCIGCGACIQSCPYDARFSHPEGYVDKCTFCIHRIKKGLEPACVAACPTKCMYFGDLDDPNSPVSEILKVRKYKTLIPEAGTKPHLYFLI